MSAFKAEFFQRRLYDYVKKRASKYLSVGNKELKRYYTDQHYYFERPFASQNFESLLKSLNDAQVTFLGDFHTFDQNIVNATRILKYLLKRKKRPIIGVELVHSDQQSILDAFLAEEMTELEFLDAIHYREAWRFPWSHYKKILEIARNQGLKVIALNSKGSMQKRDLYAGKKLSGLLKQNPQTPFLVFFGELHILPNKLPKILKHYSPETRYVIVHQNNDQLYWRQQELGNFSSLVQLGKSEYCLQTSPPWIKYESYLYWIDSLEEDPDFEVHEQILEEGLKSLSSQASDHFYLIAHEMKGLAGVDIDKEHLKDFNLKDSHSIDFILAKIKEVPTKKWKVFFQDLVRKNETFHFYGSNLFYCPNYSFNRFVTLAAGHLYSLLGEEQSLRQRNFYSLRSDSVFCLFLNQFLYSYFFSKFFNPHRKCDLLGDIKEKIQSPKTYKNYRKKLISCYEFANTGASSYSPSDHTLSYNYDVAKILGKLYGEYLYRAASGKKGMTSKKVLARLNTFHLDLGLLQNSIENLWGEPIGEDKKIYF